MLRDPKLLNMFRELLVIFRIWGLIRHSCLPTFSYMENVDVIATLFRILTRLLQSSEPDESLLGKISLGITVHFYVRNDKRFLSVY